MNNTIQKRIESAWQTLGNLGWLWVALVLALVACSPAAPVSAPAPSPTAPVTNPAPAAPVTGTLQVNISGLPAGVAANVEVKGPENFSQTLTQTTALPKLKSGTYSFTLNAVKPDSATFSGSPASLNFEASVGGSVNLSYGCSSVKAPDAVLDARFQKETGKTNYNCADLAKLKELTIVTSRLANLEGIQYATGLTNVFLGANAIAVLPGGIFDTLTNLTDLNLGSNGITALPAGIFDKLSGLKRLDLGFNRIAGLPVGIFDKLTSLTELSLRRNVIAVLPAGIFDKLTNLTSLFLDQNHLITLPSGIFGKLPNGSSVDLSTNCLVINQNPVKAFLAGLNNIRVSISERRNDACRQKTITFSSLQARLLVEGRTAPDQTDIVFFRISIDGVLQGDLEIGQRTLRHTQTATIDKTLIVNTELKIEVFASGEPNLSIGEAVLPIDADYAPGINRFSLLGSGSVYVLTLNQQ